MAAGKDVGTTLANCVVKGVRADGTIERQWLNGGESGGSSGTHPLHWVATLR